MTVDTAVDSAVSTAGDPTGEPTGDSAVRPDDAPAQQHRRATVRSDKADAVAELAQAFRTASAAMLTEYRGLSVKQLTELRRALGGDTTYAIVKNSLTSIAAKDAGLHGLTDLLTGPTAVAFVGGDPVEAAKMLRDFARSHPLLVVKGGVMDGKALSADEVRRLADLESREVLLGKLAGAMLASLSQAVYLLNAPLAQAARLAAALQAKAEQDPSVLRGGAGTPTAVSDAADLPGQSATGLPSDGPTDPAAETATDPAGDVPAATTENAATENAATENAGSDAGSDGRADTGSDTGFDPGSDTAPSSSQPSS